jgi:hypothetical protein
LEARWIDRALADRARLCRVDSLTGAQVVGRRARNYSGILIPYFHPGSDRVREYRLRRDQPDYEYDSAGNLKPKQKYLSPPGRSNMFYLLPGVDSSLLADPELPYGQKTRSRLNRRGIMAGPNEREQMDTAARLVTGLVNQELLLQN